MHENAPTRFFPLTFRDMLLRKQDVSPLERRPNKLEFIRCAPSSDCWIVILIEASKYTRVRTITIVDCHIDDNELHPIGAMTWLKTLNLGIPVS